MSGSSLRPAGPPSTAIVLMPIDDRSIREIGRWPWSRGIIAGVADEIEDGTRILKRSGVRKAAVAIARKLAVLMHAMLVKQTDFHWSKQQEHAAA
jgi:hypothetical protein